MCGRYFASEDFREQLEMMMRERGILPAVSSAAPGEEVAVQSDTSVSTAHDVFPSNVAPVFCADGDELREAPMQWGFTNPYRKGLIINARAETAREKAVFAESLEERRCLIPASGFYEWDAGKARYRFTRPDGGLLLLAGCWQEEPAAEPTGQPGGQGTPATAATPVVRRYTILTTAANESMQPIHDRMPALIDPDEIRPWLCDGSRLAEFLSRPQAGLTCQQDQGQIRMPGF